MPADTRGQFIRLDPVQKHILVVCTGNLFRSPMAAAFLERRLVLAVPTEQIKVSSAGLNARAGQEAPDFVIGHLKSVYHLDLSAHRCRPLTPALFQSADLILAMEQAQLMRLAQQYPRQTRKLHLISELAGRVADVRDVGLDPRADVPLLAVQLSDLIELGLDTLLFWLNILHK